MGLSCLRTTSMCFSSDQLWENFSEDFLSPILPQKRLREPLYFLEQEVNKSPWDIFTTNLFNNPPPTYNAEFLCLNNFTHTYFHTWKLIVVQTLIFSAAEWIWGIVTWSRPKSLTSKIIYVWTKDLLVTQPN